MDPFTADTVYESKGGCVLVVPLVLYPCLCVLVLHNCLPLCYLPLYQSQHCLPTECHLWDVDVKVPIYMSKSKVVQFQ